MELFFNFLLVRQFSTWHFKKFCINVNQKAKIEFLLHFDYTGALMLSNLPVQFNDESDRDTFLNKSRFLSNLPTSVTKI